MQAHLVAVEGAQLCLEDGAPLDRAVVAVQAHYFRRGPEVHVHVRRQAIHQHGGLFHVVTDAILQRAAVGVK